MCPGSWLSVTRGDGVNGGGVDAAEATMDVVGGSDGGQMVRSRVGSSGGGANNATDPIPIGEQRQSRAVVLNLARDWAISLPITMDPNSIAWFVID